MSSSLLTITQIARSTDVPHLDLLDGFVPGRHGQTIGLDNIIHPPTLKATSGSSAAPSRPRPTITPAVFSYSANNPIVPLKVTATYNFGAGAPVAAHGKDAESTTRYCLVGTQTSVISGGRNANSQAVTDGFEMMSDPFEAPAGTGISTFTAERFHVTNDGPRRPGCPFKLHGILSWKLVLADGSHGLVKESHNQLTVEFYFTFGSRHNLPYEYTNEFFLPLNRLAYPAYHEVKGRAWDALESSVVRGIVERLWRRGSRSEPKPMYYDARINGGQPHIVEGKVVHLERFFERTTKMVNCFDLAAVLKLALLSLGTQAGNPTENFIRDIRMVETTPWGYIRDGPCFGFEKGEAHNCNNPFWLDPTGSGHRPPKLPPLHPWRLPFSCHCYVLYKDTSGVERALDACHALSNGRDPANNNRYRPVTLVDGRFTHPDFIGNIDPNGPPRPYLAAARTTRDYVIAIPQVTTTAPLVGTVDDWDF
ncbi:hypothetical protein B0T24DRAFT_592487 [Lasiosphaeria ovina]|uniref:Uncharacterized protein n=1 Tax=Lasiosphaeria ovina TaxID=92902 RepID=A0AAE0KHU1_9PEZI|nr:hypothetical protein B0T24DRAFT_592487 [Lasiosphaeria ovina]